MTFTPAGLNLYEKILNVARDRQARIADGLSAEETDKLIALLNRVRANSAKLEE